MSFRTLIITSCVILVLCLAACGGGGSATPLMNPSQEPVDPSPPLMTTPDPVPSPFDRLADIQGEADTLRIASALTAYTFDWTDLDERVSDEQGIIFTCHGDQCEGDNGAVFTIAGLTGPNNPFRTTRPDAEAHTDLTSGLETFTFQLDTDLSFIFGPSVTFTENPSIDSYGVWGESGSVYLQVIDGPIVGTADEEAITGLLQQTSAFVMGQAAGTNPSGLGRATWQGLAEVISTSTFERGQGTVTLTIADLLNPLVDVDIVVPGFVIDDTPWGAIPVTDGRFMTGTVGTDYLDGDFYGPNHDEAYGVFDLGDYLGGFGATR